MHVGAHVSAAGGLPKAVDRAITIGAEALQIFPSSPRMWRFKHASDEDINEFKAALVEAGMGPTVFHGIYLNALAAEDEALLERSVTSLTNYMQLASAAGVSGVLFHPASHKGRGYDAVEAQFVTAVHRILDAAPGEPWLALENSAGAGDHIGSKFSELGRLVKAIDHPRIRVCLDTQHAWAASYEMTTPDGVAATMDEFDKEIGLELLAAVHANDSKSERGSSTDRHENIGKGHLGLESFKAILGHEAFANVPMYLEVPGTDKSGPNKENVDALKKVRAELGITR